MPTLQFKAAQRFSRFQNESQRFNDFQPKVNTMSQHTIAVTVGSLRHDSFNSKLASALSKLAPPEFLFV
jgi:DNA-binding HxlR family transcriptional regulator